MTQAGRILNRYITAFLFVAMGVAGLINRGQPVTARRSGHVFEGRTIWFMGLVMFLTGIVICVTAIRLHLEHRRREQKGDAYQRRYSRGRGKRRHAVPEPGENE
jgi:hypothetical protein